MALDPTYSQEYLDALPLWLKEAMNLSAPSVSEPIQQEDDFISPFVYTQPNIGLFDQASDSSDINLGIDQEDLFSMDTEDTFGIGKGLENALNLGFGLQSFDKDTHQDDKNVAHVNNLGKLSKVAMSPFFLGVPTPISLAVTGLFSAFDIAAHNQANPQNYQQSLWDVFFGPSAKDFHGNQRAARLGFTEESNPDISGRGIFFNGMHPVEQDYRYSIDPDSAVPDLGGNPYGTGKGSAIDARNPNSPNYSIDFFDIGDYNKMDINNPIDGFYNDGGGDSDSGSSSGSSGGGMSDGVGGDPI